MKTEDRKTQDALLKVAAVTLATTDLGAVIGLAEGDEEREAVPQYLKQYCLSVDPHLSKNEQEHVRSLYRLFKALTLSEKDSHHKAVRTQLPLSKGRRMSWLPLNEVEESKHWISFDGHVLQRKDVCEYFLKQIVSLLDVVTLETEKRGIQNSFFRSTSHTNLQDLHSVRRFEPRIDYIARELKTIFDFTHVFVEEDEAPVTSFALNDLRDWLVNVDSDPSLNDPYTSILQYLSWSCHASCKFCLHKNDPEGYWTKSGNWKKTMDEIMTRLKYYTPNKQALFKTQDYNFFDVLSHPNIIEILRQTRKKTKRVIQFTTNGDVLTSDFIEDLLEFKPLFFMISLNSANPLIRKQLMNNKSPETAIRCLPLLKKNHIPYSVSIVPWYENSLDDLTETLLYADRNDVYLIRINLDAYSNDFSGENLQELQNNRIECWTNVIECVRSLRKKVQTPIIFQPSLFEENLYDEVGCEPVITGVIKNSPAQRCGIRYGDRIVQIDNFIVPFKTLASNILKAYQLSNITEFVFKYKRGNQYHIVKIKEDFTPINNEASYPHFTRFPDDHNGPNPFYPYGILLQETLNPTYLWDIENIIAEHAAKNVLFLSSFLLKPTFSKVIQDTGFLKEQNVNFWIDVPQNKHFLGGSFVVGDLLVVDDFIECINNQKRPIDLVIIPSTPFGRWGRDISGKTYKEIERETGIPVELLGCKIIANL